MLGWLSVSTNTSMTHVFVNVVGPLNFASVQSVVGPPHVHVHTVHIG